MWIVPRADLTEDQLSAVQLSFTQNRVVIGGPGSGKTLVLAHRAQHALSRPGADPDRIKLLVYTKVLAGYLAEGLSDLGLPDDAVLTFDKWCLQQFTTLVGGPRPMTDKGPDWEAIRERVLEAVEAADHPPTYDVLVVDEGQDLTITAVRLLNRISQHVTFAMDGRQQLYQGIDIETACDELGVRRASASLLNAYRCTPLIVDVAAEFLPTPELAAEFRAANLLAIDGVETPVLFESEDPKAEFDELATRLSERAMLGESTLVLAATGRDEKKFATELMNRGLEVATRENLAFDDLRPMVMTYHSAKGLTVDSVFMPGLTSSTFKALTEAQLDRLLFVGTSRAIRWLWIGTREGKNHPALRRLDALVRRNSVKRLPKPPEKTFVKKAAPAPKPKPAFDPADLL